MKDTIGSEKPRRTKKPSPTKGTVVHYNYIPQSILPAGVDGRTKEGRRLKMYSAHLAGQIPDSDDPIVRARIVNCAALLVESEKLAWKIAEGRNINPRDLASLTYSSDMALNRLLGQGIGRGRPRADGSPANGDADLVKMFSPRPRTSLARAFEEGMQ